ncbi:MAG: hypothetical protein KBC41_01575 [Candidatus Pacebacteria bacterium]|nr:hypothetical protein [Candidatus Paceibacterota bacterium]
MEQPNSTNEVLKTPENLKLTTFNEIMRSVLFRFGQEIENVNSFRFGEKEVSINTTASAVKAIGQISSQMSRDVYNESVNLNKYVRTRI